MNVAIHAAYFNASVIFPFRHGVHVHTKGTWNL